MWWIEYPPLFCSSRQLSVVHDIIIECARDTCYRIYDRILTGIFGCTWESET